MSKFKVGDCVEIVDGLSSDNCSDKVVGAQFTIAEIYKGKWGREYVNEPTGVHFSRLKLITSAAPATNLPKPTNFILQYELDEDPFETFETMKEVEARIKELAKRSDLKKDNIKVYEVAKTYDITLETRVLFGSKIRMDEKSPRRKYRHTEAFYQKRLKKTV